MLYDLICGAKAGDKKAMMELIERFSPLFRKYARKLNYEDAYEDITLYYIELIQSMNLDRIASREDGVIISYINISIINYYNKRIRKMMQYGKEVVVSDLTEEQKYHIEAKSAKSSKADFLEEWGLRNLLSKKECQIIYLIYAEGYTAAEIAKISNKSRQAVNQLKNRALKKIANFLKRR